MIRIGKVDVENFLTIGKASVDFADRGLVAVVGPNGSGKSSLFAETLYYGCFGVSERYGNERDKVVNRFVGENCHLHIPILIDDTPDKPVNVLIDSYRLHKKFGNEVHLLVNGKDSRGRTNNHTWEKIVKLLDMDVVGFQNSIIFGQSMSQYAGLTDAQQKAIVERLLGCSWIPKAYELAGSERDELDKELTVLADKYDVIGEKIKQLNAELDEYKKKRDTFEDDRQRRIDEELSCIRELKDTLFLEQEINGLQEKISKNNDILELKEELDEQIKKIELYRKELESDISHIVKQIQKIVNRLEDLSKMKITDNIVCESCGQRITVKSVDTLAIHLKEEIRTIESSN